MIEIDSTDRSIVRSSLSPSLSLSLAPRDGPFARASTLDAFDDTVRPRASAASADDGARESDVDGLRNCAQLGPERRQSASHDSRKRDCTGPYPEEIFFNSTARARLRLPVCPFVCLSISPLRVLRCALRYEFSSSRGSVARTTSTVNATAGGPSAPTASPRAADEDADVARSSPRTRARTPSARRPPRMMPA